MLEFNSEHKKVDLSHSDMGNGKYKKSGKVMLGGILLSAVILFSGCVKTVSKDSTSDLNRAMICIGNEYVVVDIDGYTRWSESNTELKLTDGTTLTGHPSDISLYNNKSETMQKVESSISPIYIYDVDYHIEDDNLDRALVQVGDDLVVLELSGYTRWSESNTELKLTDGTSLTVHPMELTLFSSKSAIMSQVQEQTLDNNNSKTR